MKFPKFPYLVQKEIVSHLTYNNLFFFSLCSQKTHNFIVRSQKTQFERIEQIVYTADRDQMKIVAETCSKTTMIMEIYNDEMNPIRTRDKMTVDVSGTKYFDCFGHPSNEDDEESNDEDGESDEEDEESNEEDEETNEDDKESNEEDEESDEEDEESNDEDEKSDEEDVEPTALADPDEDVLIVKAIHSQILRLFGTNINYGMTQGDNCSYLPILANFRTLRLIGDGADAVSLEQFLEVNPNLEYFCCDIEIDDVRGLSEETKRKIYQIDTVDIARNEFLCAEVFKHFNGRRAFLQMEGTTNQEGTTQLEIVEFLNKWKSGEGFQNLELIRARGISNDVNIDEVAAQAGCKQANSVVTFPFIEKYTPEPSVNNGTELESRYYIVRESDCHVATMEIEQGRLSLGVWNMTETEFLEKFA